ncbi:exostosin family-domain-containing protein [Pavlovales sp. CCMP2436]|nr:exostosin family-domain-containing protein [Pavlovales sp. CCMP2436]
MRGEEDAASRTIPSEERSSLAGAEARSTEEGAAVLLSTAALDNRLRELQSESDGEEEGEGEDLPLAGPIRKPRLAAESPPRARATPRCKRVAALAAVLLGLCLAAALVAVRRRQSSGEQPTSMILRQLNSTFNPSCGRTARLGTCPGYAQCMREVLGFDEEDFLLRQGRRKGPELERPRRVCTKASCVDRSACKQPFKLYQYTHADVAHLELAHCLSDTNFTDARTASMLTADPQRACAFWFELKLGSRCPHLAQLPRLPHWRGNGINHIFVNHDDGGVDSASRELHFGAAAIAQGHATIERFVPGLDIALGLHPRLLPGPRYNTNLATLAPWRRRYLLSFKGTESHPARARASFHHDEAKGVIVVFFPNGHHCMVSTSGSRPYALDRTKRLPQLHADCCARLLALYRAYDYKQLMNSTFTLVLPGAQPASFRLAEALAHGSIPVFFGFDEAILPWEDLINWPALSLNVPVAADFERALVPMLEALARDRARLQAMQREGSRVFRRWFETLDASAGDRATVETLRQRFSFERGRRR